jgi:hypothetical protein
MCWYEVFKLMGRQQEKEGHRNMRIEDEEITWKRNTKRKGRLHREKVRRIQDKQEVDEQEED